MTEDRRNPYVILGIAFGTDAKAARTGFARASRRLRHDDHARYKMEDLTWALHQIEQIIESPSKAFDVYRLPADPAALNVERPGVFNPSPEPIPRITLPLTDQQRSGLRERAITELFRTALTENPLTLKISKPFEQWEHVDD